MDVKDLWRCKSVCKQWNTLIQSRYFANKYAMHKSTTYSCGNFFEKDCSVWIKKYVVGLATCDGLELQMEITNQRSLVTSLILSPKWEYSFFVTNITICQSLPIPRPFSSVETCQTKNFGFVAIPSTLEYKVVCFYTDENNKKSCALITLGGDENKWRYLDIPTNPQNRLGRYYRKRTLIVEAGVDVHCIRDVKIGSRYVYEIVSLDLETENFTISNVYKDFIANGKNVHPIDWNGSLAFVRMDGKKLNVMVWKDYKNKKWRKFAVTLTFLDGKKNANTKFFPLIAQKGLLWFHSDQDKEICYDLEKKRIIQTIASRGGREGSRAFGNLPSLVSLKGMQPQ